MSHEAPRCPDCGQPGTLSDDGWHCRNEACPEYGQKLADEEPPPREEPGPELAG